MFSDRERLIEKIAALIEGKHAWGIDKTYIPKAFAYNLTHLILEAVEVSHLHPEFVGNHPSFSIVLRNADYLIERGDGYEVAYKYLRKSFEFNYEQAQPEPETED